MLKSNTGVEFENENFLHFPPSPIFHYAILMIFDMILFKKNLTIHKQKRKSFAMNMTVEHNN